jgi:hypothetical protein
VAQGPIEIIRDPGSDLEAFLAACVALPWDRNQPAVWTAVANDGRYRTPQRRQAVIELFRGHITAGTTLGELGQILAGAPWLDEDDVRLVEDVGGRTLPVTPTFEDAIFAIYLFTSDWRPDDFFAVYLRVPRYVTKRDLLAAIHGKATDQIFTTPILEIGMVLEAAPSL